MRVSTLAFALVSAPLAAADPAGGISPQFREAAEAMLQSYHSKELTKTCGSWSEDQNVGLRKSEKGVDKSKKTQAESSIRNLLYDYATAVEAWQAASLWSGTNADCTPTPEYAAFFKACREAITASLKGGAIAPAKACQK